MGGRIANCYNWADVEGGSARKVGGIVGCFEGEWLAVLCNYGNITTTDSSMYVGGIVGEWNGSGQMMSCRNYGNIGVNANYVGGIAGYRSSNTTMSGYSNSGTITSNKSYVGDIVGYGG